MSATKKYTPLHAKDKSLLGTIRRGAPSYLPTCFASAPHMAFDNKEALGAVADHDEIKRDFPNTYGAARIVLKPAPSNAANSSPIKIAVVLSGGQAPGGHNVIAGVYDYAKKISSASVVMGFLDGPQGIYNGQYCIIDDNMMDTYRNTGGFDMIGSGRHKIEKPAEFKAALAVCQELDLDGVVIIGGDDSNTNAAVLAEYFVANNCKTKVCGAPKTIDGDLKVDPYIPISFGFDTACRSYSELIGNLGQDTLSTQKYYHFVRLMGRAASNIALECALQTRPNICLISEEVAQKKSTLLEITDEVCQVILKRAKAGKNYGIILLPEGLIEFIPEFNHLIEEINDVLATGVEPTEASVIQKLSDSNRNVFMFLPEQIKQQLLLDRDPHGNVQVAKIETEKLLAQTVEKRLKDMQAAGDYSGSFVPRFHSYGYEGRCGYPSQFDATYCYVLGQTVAAMVALKLNGMIASVNNLHAPVESWVCGGVPITMMCHMEKRHGHMKPVIKKALVELEGAPFACFSAQRAMWAEHDLYRSPGPIQFFLEETANAGAVELCITLTLELLKCDDRMSLGDVAAAVAAQSKVPPLNGFQRGTYEGVSAKMMSSLQRRRADFSPRLAPCLAAKDRVCVKGTDTQCRDPREESAIKGAFACTYGSPVLSIEERSERVLSEERCKAVSGRASIRRIGVAFTGRQAPGGHSVVAGIFDSLGAQAELVGFVGGTDGLIRNKTTLITEQTIAPFRSQGGSELLCRSTDTIPASKFDDILKTCEANGLEGLVLIGGSRTASHCAYLAEHFESKKSSTKVLCIPVDISGSMKDGYVETTVGFDTATKAAAQVVGNNATDGASAKKYYYFMKVMGQEPSFYALEVALLTSPNYVLLSEEVRQRNMTLSDIVRSIADVIEKRAAVGKNYGTVLIPEGLADSIPELRLLGNELDGIFAETSGTADPSVVRSKLSLWSRALLESLPDFMQAQLLLSKGSDDSAIISQAETEKLLAHFVDIELGIRKKKGTYKGAFSAICSFIGYQARGALPTNFDCTYAYNLGFAVVDFIAAGANGYMVTVSNLKESSVEKWEVLAVPTCTMVFSSPSEGNGNGNGHRLTVKSACVDMGGEAYQQLQTMRAADPTVDSYSNPGPIQFDGPRELAYAPPCTLMCDKHEYRACLEELQSAIKLLQEKCRPGADGKVVKMATKSVAALNGIIDVVNGGQR